MTKQQKEDLFLLLQKFCSDNNGNRLNEWIAESLLNRANMKLEKIYLDDNDCVLRNIKEE